MNTRNDQDYIPAEKVIRRMTMARMLETIRDDMELTKVQMAEKLGMSKQHYNNIIKEGASVSISRAIQFARALNDSEKVFIRVAIDDELARVDQPKYRVEIFDEQSEMRA